MNLPPQPAAAAVRERLAQATAAVLRGADPARLMTYRPGGGGAEDRAAGAAWLAPLLPGLPAERVLVCGGGQAALTALLTTLARCGDTVLAERVTYPGFRAAAAQLGLRVEGVAMDGDGLLPDALEEAVARHQPRALYTVPTIHNPTTATMPAARRAAVAAVLRRHALPVIEDDAYGALPPAPLAPLAALVPDLVWYLATLSKSLLPGLRIAYLVAPDAARAARAGTALRATAQMAPPLSAAIATRWIRDGTAHAIRDAVRAESTARQDLARRLLPPGSFDAHPQGHHLWLRLSAPWTATAFAGEVRRSGLAVVPDSAFTTGTPEGRALRLSLGAAPDRDTLHAALTRIATTLARDADALAEIV
nr:PLP-dependent aminotransferase family protein [Azospirillum oleiclasticum]